MEFGLRVSQTELFDHRSRLVIRDLLDQSRHIIESLNLLTGDSYCQQLSIS